MKILYQSKFMYAKFKADLLFRNTQSIALSTEETKKLLGRTKSEITKQKLDEKVL